MGPGCFIPNNPDLADTLGDTDFAFEDFDCFDFCWIQNFPIQVPRFPEIWLGPGRALALGQVGPRVPSLTARFRLFAPLLHVMMQAFFPRV